MTIQTRTTDNGTSVVHKCHHRFDALFQITMTEAEKRSLQKYYGNPIMIGCQLQLKIKSDGADSVTIIQKVANIDQQPEGDILHITKENVIMNNTSTCEIVGVLPLQ